MDRVQGEIQDVLTAKDTVIILTHEEKKMFYVLLNTLRQKHGRKVIKPSPQLMQAMEIHARNLAEHERYWHERVVGVWADGSDSLVSYQEWYEAFDIEIDGWLPDEIIAFTLPTDCQREDKGEKMRCVIKKTLTAFMNSELHRPSLLKLFARAYGFAIVARADGSYVLLVAVQKK